MSTIIPFRRKLGAHLRLMVVELQVGPTRKVLNVSEVTTFSEPYVLLAARMRSPPIPIMLAR